jgi:ribosomal-protein-alanine N-acetyltransferase
LRDGTTWLDVRRRNDAWLRPWEATRPGEDLPSLTFGQMVRRMRADARAGRSLPFVVTYDRRLVGQLTVAGITWGSLCSAHIGYWVDRGHAGRGIMPTAVALAVDHCFFGLGLHRIEVCIRPENTNSRRVVEKLGFREEGLRPRYLHIDGDWRDHLVYVLTAEEIPGGLLTRWRATRGPLAAQ